MIRVEFMKKWATQQKVKDSWWASDPRVICWALSYDAKSEMAYDVCRDFLSIEDEDFSFDCSVERAKMIVEAYDKRLGGK